MRTTPDYWQCLDMPPPLITADSCLSFQMVITHPLGPSRLPYDPREMQSVPSLTQNLTFTSTCPSHPSHPHLTFLPLTHLAATTEAPCSFSNTPGTCSAWSFGLAVPSSPDIFQDCSLAFCHCHLPGKGFLPSLKRNTSSITFTPPSFPALFFSIAFYQSTEKQFTYSVPCLSPHYTPHVRSTKVRTFH